MTILAVRYRDALHLAFELHAGQIRKGSSIPYVSHVLAVSGIALEHGADENEAIAALLHDAAEDAGGRATLARIRRQFGDLVADIVDGCTDTYETPKPPWKARKEAYIKHVFTASSSVRLVSASDKLHNARSILSDLRVHGVAVWSRFTATPEETKWYYRALLAAFSEHWRTPLVEELNRTFSEIERISS